LPAFHLVGHRRHHNLPAEAGPPQLFTGARVEGVEVAFTPAGEQQIRRRRQHPAVRDVVLFEFPFHRAGLRVHGHHRAVSDLVGPVVDRAAAPNADGRRARGW